MIEASSDAFKPLALTPGVPREEFKNFVNSIYETGASDIKFQSNDFVWADINRFWVKASNRRLEAQEVERILTYVNDQSALGLVSSGDPVDDRVDLYRGVDDLNEFRLNATGCMVAGVREGLGVTLRAIPKQIPSLKKLGIEKEIVDNFFPRYGLILIVGTTGSGKSTLLGAANRERLVERRHDPVTIGTYEDPIEYSLAGLAQGFMPEPVQMAIGRGRHLKDFNMVGANAMRRRFDVIVAGEIRDLESAKAGCELSRTGHSVLATMHVDTPAQAFDRMIKFYGADQQESEAYALLDQIRLIVAQKLARTTDGKKMAFRSWIVVDRAIKSTLYSAPIQNWSRIVAQEIQKRGADFDSVSYSALSEGRISGEVFREVSGMTVNEAKDFVLKRGGDVSQLG